MNTKNKLVIFDWDDTIVTSGYLINDAINDASGRHGFAPIPRSDAKKYYGLSMRDSFPLLFEDKWEQVRDDFYMIYAERALDYLETITPMTTLLKRLAEKDHVHMSVISNKTGQYLRTEARHVGLDHHFDHMIGSGDTSHDKPSPKIIQHLLERLQTSQNNAAHVDPKDILFIGDSLADIECAHHFGANGILINVREHTLSEYGKWQPKVVFKNYEECHDWLIENI